MSPQPTPMFSAEFLALYAEAKTLLGGAGASRVLGFIAEAQAALDEYIATEYGHGETVDVEELGVEWLSEHLDESHRTVYRRNAEFRRVFPQYSSPLALAREQRAAA